MVFSRRRFRKKSGYGDDSGRPPGMDNHVSPGHTGSETSYLKSLVDSHQKVTVVMIGGERLQGYIRYYDSDCFSLGLSADGPRFFLRKDSVSYIAEE